MTVDPTRIRTLRATADARQQEGPVIYWINRERRIADNWALLHAQQQAIDRGTALRVVFCLVPRLSPEYSAGRYFPR